ncbi:MAG: hypothetical protein JW913_17270 [Chitinispirillaceae bacterium]|nr:hypothetical protein [Chitinispirillaceae bacterium]
MKNILITVFSLGTMTIFYVSCGTAVSTGGGTGTETVNTYAMRPDGTPAAGAVAQIIEARFWIDSIHNGASPVLQQTIADENGRIEICFPEHDAKVNLQIDHGDGALLLPLPASARDALDTLRLRPPSSYSGTFDTSAALPSRVMLAGTSYQASVDQAGAFSFATVAPGFYALLSVNGTSSSAPVINDGIALTLKEGTSLAHLALPAIADRILIDNFESGIGPTSLGRIFPVLGWYVLSDSLYYFWDPAAEVWKQGETRKIGTSFILYDSVPDGKGGQALRFRTVLDKISLYANALIGFSLKPLSGEGADLSAMSGFSFRAAGKGTIRVHFETRDLDSASAMRSHYAYPLKLTSTMSDYFIPVDSLRIIEPVPYADEYPWSRESRHVERIEFVFAYTVNNRGDTLSCVLDDFFLEGIPVAALLPGS